MYQYGQTRDEGLEGLRLMGWSLLDLVPGAVQRAEVEVQPDR